MKIFFSSHITSFLRIFFQKILPTFLLKKFDQRSALVYVKCLCLKGHRFQSIQQLHELSGEQKSKQNPEKAFQMLLIVTLLRKSLDSKTFCLFFQLFAPQKFQFHLSILIALNY